MNHHNQSRLVSGYKFNKQSWMRSGLAGLALLLETIRLPCHCEPYRGLIFWASLSYMFFKSALIGESFTTVSQRELKFLLYYTSKTFPTYSIYIHNACISFLLSEIKKHRQNCNFLLKQFGPQPWRPYTLFVLYYSDVLDIRLHFTASFHSFITQILPATSHKFQQIHILWRHTCFCGGFWSSYIPHKSVIFVK